MDELLNRIKCTKANQAVYDIPEDAEGEGLIDTTRGSLGHWLSIKDKHIEHYNVIISSAWNCSPADVNGKRGVIEEALIGTEITNGENQVEIGRIVRSFDPCISCATHVVGEGFKPVELVVWA